jgi:DNA-binding transcriptional regulator LsrR (DeoR family)
LSETRSLRLKAAWAYYNQGLTQKDVAERLGVSRSTVVRLLDEALKRGEVRIWIDEDTDECIALAQELEARFNLDEAIVVPAPPVPDADAVAAAVGLALGRLLSEVIEDHWTIGVGWGRTLTSALASFRPPRRDGVKVVSLLGGIVEAKGVNPVDFSWRVASQLGAECYLFPAPLIVDSPETRTALMDRCGLDRLIALARQLDLAVVSVGDVTPHGTSLSRLTISPADLDGLIARGAVCDFMCQFLDAEGRTVAHPIADRILSVDLDLVAAARHKILATGGTGRAPALAAAIRRYRPHTLVTDESAARALLVR